MRCTFKEVNSMKRQEYDDVLSRLPIENPTSEDMAIVCPHLTEKQAVAAFNNDKGYVACPSLRIRGGFQVVSFHKESDEQSPILMLSSVGRTSQFYEGDQSHDVFYKYKYMDEAMKFAENNWGDELILDTWEAVLQIYIQDPSKLVDVGFIENQPKQIAVLFVALNRSLKDIRKDHSYPESKLLDEAILEMTLDIKIGNEIKGERRGDIENNCAYCGYGLGLNLCRCCGHKFRDDKIRTGWGTPLSPKMVKFLQQNGHRFGQDPNIALNKERLDYKRCL